MTNPFDLRTIVLAKHAQHVVLIHFPIALFLVGVGFDMAAARWKNPSLAAAAYYNLIAASLATVPALITGLIAWQWALEGRRLKGLLLFHMVGAFTASILIGIVGWLHFRSGRKPELVLPRYRFAIEILAAGLLMLTAHLGGFLSGVNAG